MLLSASVEAKQLTLASNSSQSPPLVVALLLFIYSVFEFRFVQQICFCVRWFLSGSLPFLAVKTSSTVLLLSFFIFTFSKFQAQYKWKVAESISKQLLFCHFSQLLLKNAVSVIGSQGQGMEFEQQLVVLSAAFVRWSAEEKKAFFSQLLERVIPGRLFALAEWMEAMSLQHSEKFLAELRAVLSFVDSWSDAQRNVMVDHLETLDCSAVRQFDDMIAQSSGQA